MALIDKVVQVLKNGDYKLIEDSIGEDVDTAISDVIIVAINKRDKIMHLTFNLALKPDETAFLTVNLIGLNHRYKYVLNPSFVMDSDGKILVGDEAIKYYNNSLQEDIINNFLLEQQKIHMLHHMKPAGTA